jgi:hypothetical protein
MLWFKRNLFLAVGGLVALALLGYGVWILISGIQRNSELEGQVEETKTRLNNLYNSPEPFPSSNNIDTAKKEAEKLRDAAAKSKKYFGRVPVEKVTGLSFRTYRDNTIDELRRMAAAAPAELPNKAYAFSFTVQKEKAEFSPSTYPMVPEQMAEVKAICSLLFDARVSRLGNLRRAKVSDEDIRAGGTDYNNLLIETNTLAQVVTSPYEITFHSYSSDLAQVMTAFRKSPFGLVVKAVQVEPEEGMKADAPGSPPPQPESTPRLPTARQPRQVPPNPTVQGRPPLQPPPNPLPYPGARRAAADRPTILLNEKRLKVTVLLYVVKPLK